MSTGKPAAERAPGALRALPHGLARRTAPSRQAACRGRSAGAGAPRGRGHVARKPLPSGRICRPVPTRSRGRSRRTVQPPTPDARPTGRRHRFDGARMTAERRRNRADSPRMRCAADRAGRSRRGPAVRPTSTPILIAVASRRSRVQDIETVAAPRAIARQPPARTAALAVVAPAIGHPGAGHCRRYRRRLAR